MVKRLLEYYDMLTSSKYFKEYYPTAPECIVLAVKLNGWIRKGKQQLLADYVMLELLEQGRL